MSSADRDGSVASSPSGTQFMACVSESVERERESPCVGCGGIPEPPYSVCRRVRCAGGGASSDRLRHPSLRARRVRLRGARWRVRVHRAYKYKLVQIHVLCGAGAGRGVQRWRRLVRCFLCPTSSPRVTPRCTATLHRPNFRTCVQPLVAAVAAVVVVVVAMVPRLPLRLTRARRQRRRARMRAALRTMPQSRRGRQRKTHTSNRVSKRRSRVVDCRRPKQD